MGDVSSAIPNDLIMYGGGAESHNRQLMDWARHVTQALDALRRSNPDPGLLPSVPDLGASLNAYAVKKEAIDKFVYDVGMAFMTLSNRDWMSPISVSDDALNKELDKEEGAQGRKYADQVARGEIPLDQALAMIGDDPIETAAFFKELGPVETLDLVGNITDPGQLQKFDEALATATQSPTWDPSFTDELVNGDYYDYENLGPPERRWMLTADLLKYGVYSEDFLTKTGDAYLFHQKDDGVNHGAELALSALARNPDAALNYLNGTDPTDHDQTRLTHLLDGGVGLTAQMPGGEEEFQRYQAQINHELGLTTLAANAAPDAGPESQAKLLDSISKVPVSVVPNPFRDVVTELIGTDMQLFGDKLPSSDPNHPQNATDSPLSWEARQRLFLIAMYDFDRDNAHQLVPNEGRVDTLREAMLGYAMSNQDLAAADPTVWIHNAASMNALMSDGLAAYPYYQEELKKQQEEFSSIFIGISLLALPVAGPFAVEAGLSEAAFIAIEDTVHSVVMYTEHHHSEHGDLPWETADEQLNNDLMNARVTMVINQYQHDPNAAWIPDNLRGKPLTDPALRNYFGDVALAADTSDLPAEARGDDGVSQHAGQLITELNSFTGLFRAHDPQQVQEMMQH
jgi:hypothetical protein